MSVVLIGTDHGLQQSVFLDDKTKAWLPRNGFWYRKLLAYCIREFGIKAVLEETHVDQERKAPTIGSIMAKERGLVWQTLGLAGQPGLYDCLSDPPLIEAILSNVKPELLAGIYDLKKHSAREAFMYTSILQSFQKHGSVLAVVGYIHLGVLARMFETRQMPTHAFIFTYPLVIDETRS
jgi:hypothetical protein